MPKLSFPGDRRAIFAGGEWLPVSAENTIPSVSPIDETEIGQVPDATASDVDATIESIRPALGEWTNTSAAERADYLHRLGEEILKFEDDIADIETLDAGLTTTTSHRDVRSAVHDMTYYAGLASEIKGDTFPADGDTLSLTLREPYGIALRITAFNHPFQFAVKAAAPVLLAGNAVILKPSEHTSLSTLALAEIASRVLPPGTLNVITGRGESAGAALVSHPDVRRIGFTGSVPTGRAILAQGAASIKNVTLELGGKNPLVICEGVSPNFAADVAVKAMNFTNAGQSCQSTSRVLVHTSLYEKVVREVAERMSGFRIGDPRRPDTQVGPLAFRRQYERVMSYLEAGREDGARVVVGGGRPDGQDRGYYVSPTLFADVAPSMRVAREEIFGPVLVMVPWSDRDELVKLMNDTEYGLYSRVLSPSMREGIALAREMQAGTVLVNTGGQRTDGMPFGGYKQSGIGKQGCLAEILSYTQEKGVVLKL